MRSAEPPAQSTFILYSCPFLMASGAIFTSHTPDMPSPTLDRRYWDSSFQPEKSPIRVIPVAFGAHSRNTHEPSASRWSPKYLCALAKSTSDVRAGRSSRSLRIASL